MRLLPIANIFALCLASCVVIPRAPARAGRPPATADQRFLIAHYMPWFEAAPNGQSFGWHWTMNHYHPERSNGGRPEAASHYFPLLGLYDSTDPDSLECHVLLMKLAGIDGVFIDWYGTEDYLDYARNHRCALRLIPVLKKAGLKFAVVFEDETVPKLISAHRLDPADAVRHGEGELRWLQEHWFSNPAYLAQDRRPLFLVFGNGYYKGEQWDRIFAALAPQPILVTEAYRRPPAAGAFDWPQPAGGTEKALRDLEAFYARASEWSMFIPAAFPRFHDIYEEAGVHKSWGRIDDRNGKTYLETLERAMKSRAAIIQLATWNDWGEGTQIEPSQEFGYRDLEDTQRLRRRYLDPTFRCTAGDLRLPVRLYHLRKHLPQDAALRARLDNAAAALFAGDTQRARKELTAETQRTQRSDGEETADERR